MPVWTGRKEIDVPVDTDERASRPEQIQIRRQFVGEVEVFARSNNTASIWIGGKDVSADPGYEAGVELAADTSYTFGPIDLADIWIAGTVNGEGVTWNALPPVE